MNACMVAVVGDGIFGSLLTYYLGRSHVTTHWYTNSTQRKFSSSLASGGLVRSYVPDKNTIKHAAWSLKYYWRWSPNYWNIGSITTPYHTDSRNVDFIRRHYPEFTLRPASTFLPSTFQVYPKVGAIYERTAGFVDAAEELKRLYREAQSSQYVTILPKADAVSLDNSRATVSSTKGTAEYSHIYIAAWAATLSLCRWINPDDYFLKRISYAVFKFPEAYSTFGLPCILDESEDYWFRPMPEMGANHALAGYGRTMRPPSVFPAQTYDREYGDAVRERLKCTLPLLESSHLCYTVDSADIYRTTTDAPSILRNNLVTALTGFSGGGFKLAPSYAHLLTASLR